LGTSTEEVTVIDCSTVPDSLEGLDIKVDDIFDEIDANDDHMISEEEGRAAMACAFEKGWITEAEQSSIFDYFGGHAGEDNLDIEEMKAGFRGAHEITDFDFGLETESCVDLPWLNNHGHDCAIISTDPNANGDWTDKNGVKASEACCKFGGGDRKLKVE
jgi:hypothetical protein